MSRSLKGWLHGGSPEDTICFKDPMNELRKRIDLNPRYFEELIECRLLKNNHCLGLSIEPAVEHNEKIERQVSDAVAGVRKKFTESDLEAEKRKFDSFRAFQKTPDSQDLLDKIPSLDLDDVPADIRKINTEISTIEKVPLYKHDLFTNGIIYVDFAVDIRDISDEEGMLLPVSKQNDLFIRASRKKL